MGFNPGGSGSSSISTSSDVALTNTVDNDVLTYSATLGKWQNKQPTAGGTTTDATTTSKGVVKLAGDLGGTADLPTVPGLSAKATDANVVHLAGTETITGNKNFTGTLQSASQPVVTTTDARLSDTRTPTDNSVTTTKLQNNSVTYAKLSPTSASTGQVLAYNGTALAWATPGGLTATTVKTANYTAAPSDYVPLDSTAGAIIVTLPTAPADGTRVAVKLINGTNACTVTRGGSDVFNSAAGASTLTLASVGIGVTLQYAATGAIWYSLESTPLSALNGAYAPASGPVPAAYAAINDARFVTAIAGRKVSDFTLALTDAGTIIEAESSSNITVTVPASSSVPFQDNTLIEIAQAGAGQVTVSPATNVTLLGPTGFKSRAQWSSVSLRKRPGSGATLPTANMLMRFRADDLTGANGSSVASWPDTSGNNLPAAAQSTAGSRPVLTFNVLNGHKGVTFDGSNDCLTLSGAALSIAQNATALTTFVVYTCSSVSSGARTLLSLSNGTATSSIRVLTQHRNQSTGTNLAGGRRLDTDSGVYATSPNAVVAGEAVVLAGVYDYAGGGLTLYKNGTSVATGTFASTGATANTPSLAGSIGSNAAGAAEFFYGNIMEIIAYSTIDAGVRASVDTYIQNTYGISTADFAGIGDQWVITGDTTT